MLVLFFNYNVDFVCLPFEWELVDQAKQRKREKKIRRVGSDEKWMKQRNY